MQDLCSRESAKYQVLPLDNSVATRMVTPRPSDHRRAGRCSPTPARHRHAARRRAELLNTSYTITAEIDVPQGGAEGMLTTDGGRFGGYGLYLLKGKPVFLWNLLGSRAGTLGRHRGAGARQAYARVRLQI